ncbi:MAG: hypothetical protein K2Y28_01360 [Burkholderiaceae bacterium]|nr:hypothetical protein [Burkholderiaceae bacterium]
MAGNSHTNLRAVNGEGHQVSLQHTSTDSPILPAENLKQLYAIDPALVDWVIKQTSEEAEHRRQQESRINVFVLIERMGGLVAGLLVSLFGISAGGYIILQGHDWAGVGICGTGLASIVSILVARQKANEKNNRANPAPSKPRRKPQPKK